MSICAACGNAPSSGLPELCGHHQHAFAHDWAAWNRAACDFFNRKIVPPRVEGQVAAWWGILD